MPKNASKPKSRNTRSLASGRLNPPQISSNVTYSHTYRFTSTSGTATVLTPTSIGCAAGGIVTVANTTLVAFAGSVKVNRISIWTPPASQGAAATCSVDWVGLGNTPNFEVSDTTVSVSRPAHITTVPPKQSLAAFWQVASTSSLCTLTAPSGSIIDVQLSLILSDNDLTSAITSAIATGSVGGFYYLSLDPNATHRYVPVSLTTTT